MLKNLLDEAWELRLSRFGRKICFAYPNRTKAVSLTGDTCKLQCAHCGGHYLKSMVSLEAATSLAEKGMTSSLLISGGCSESGKVPYGPFAPNLEVLKETQKLNFHVGLVDEEEAVRVGKLATAVSFDFVGDDDTIREVYGINATIDDYTRTYLALSKHATVVPHICIGLRGGSISGEYMALEILRAIGAPALVFIVFIPTRGTLYEARLPPSVSEVARLLARARIDFPSTPIYLGCMRPGGRYRRAIDILALRAGVNKIVNPSPASVKVAELLGFTIDRGEECCVL